MGWHKSGDTKNGWLLISETEGLSQVPFFNKLEFLQAGYLAWGVYVTRRSVSLF